MDLKTLTDAELLTRTEGEVRKEREILTSVLHHLREIDRRRLYSSMQYESLFAFAVGHFKYEKDQAYRRIAAMKLLRDVPEIEEKINQGELTLTHLNFAQTLFKQEKKIHNVEMSRDQKISVIERIANTSTREAEVIMLSLSSAPEKIKPDRVRPITEKLIEMKFSAHAELEDKVERLKGMLAHKHPNLSLGELFEKLCDLGLQEWSPAKFAAPRKRCLKIEMPKLKSHTKSDTQSNSVLETAAQSASHEFRQARVELDLVSEALSKAWAELEPNVETRAKTRAGAKAGTKSNAQIRRDVFTRAKGRCENCASTYALEIDHIQPQALGGPSTPDNLRVLCRSCNQRAAIKVFGIHKMDRHLN